MQTNKKPAAKSSIKTFLILVSKSFQNSKYKYFNAHVNLARNWKDSAEHPNQNAITYTKNENMDEKSKSLQKSKQ